MVQGPFHAVVGLSHYTLDLYLQREGMERVFIKRVRVGLGADGATPVGAWKVGKGKKMLDATWFPPASSPIHQPLRPGDPNYPLGKAGYWIGLVGIDPNTVSADGYGLHGTNDPDSIGKAESLGCIRLADPDIELVFSLLYEEWSTVQTVP
jgi:lipoprotein-anchoring transpeptidase ErfK/SrfK